MRSAGWLTKKPLPRVALALAFSLAVAGCGGGIYRPGTPPADTVTFPTASTQGWLQQYGTGYQPAGSTGANSFNGDTAYGVATDPQGNVIVLDETFGAFSGFTSNNQPQFAVVKFDNAGNRLWVQQFGSGSSDFPRAITTDAQGNIFIGGSTNGTLVGATGNYSREQSVVLKLNPAGQVVWGQQFPQIGPSGVTSLAADSQGNVIVGGEILPSSYQGNYYFQNNSLADDAEGGYVMKLAAADGSTLWNQSNNSVGFNYEVNGVAVDGQGNVIAVGGFPAMGASSSSAPMMIAKLNGSNGVPVWTQMPQTVSYYGAQNPVYTQVALDSQGNIFVGGVDASTGFSRCVVTSLANSTGTQQWQQEFGAAQLCNPGTIAADAAGNVLMAGTAGNPFFPTSTASSSTTNQNDIFLAKLTGSGTAVWLQQFGTGQELGPTSSSAVAQVFVATDKQNHAYVAGTTAGAFAGFTNSNHANELFVTQFGP